VLMRVLLLFDPPHKTSTTMPVHQVKVGSWEHRSLTILSTILRSVS
jgi:hypothetical protein